jgi:hypothetical protein
VLERNVTAKPEVAVALSVKGTVPEATLPNGLKVMVCVVVPGAPSRILRLLSPEFAYIAARRRPSRMARSPGGVPRPARRRRVESPTLRISVGNC